MVGALLCLSRGSFSYNSKTAVAVDVEEGRRATRDGLLSVLALVPLFVLFLKAVFYQPISRVPPSWLFSREACLAAG